MKGKKNTQSFQLMQKKTLDKIKHAFTIKKFNKPGIEGNYST